MKVHAAGIANGMPVASADGAKIAVCLLTFNHVNVVESSVMTVLQQTVADCEILLSDDCSTDGTWEVLLAIATREPRVRVIRPPRNLGMAGNANFAVAQVSREYIALLHHDDLCSPDLLQKWSGVLDRHPDVSFVFNPYAKAESGQVEGEPMPGERIDGSWLLQHYLFPRWGCLIRGTAMIRRSAWRSEGGMRTQFGLLADIDLWMRLAMRGPAGYVAEPVITVRHARPGYYPDIYRGDYWSWTRLRLLYEIHAQNRQAYWRVHPQGRRLQWALFRLRLSLETGKWIAYALVRRKYRMLRSCAESATPYDLWPLRIFRALMLGIARVLPAA